MKRKLFALLLCMAFICTLSLPVYADSATTSSDGYSVLISDIPKVCPTCGSKLHAKWFSTSGAEVELSINDNGTIKIPAGSGVYAKITLYCTNCKYEKTEHRILGLDWGSEHPGVWNVEKAPSGIGRKDLPGYNNYDTGSPAINPDGTYRGDFAMIYDGFYTHFGNSFTKFSLKGAVIYDNGSFTDYGNGNVSSYVYLDTGSNVTMSNDVFLAYYFQAPVTGYYDITIPSAGFSTRSKSYQGYDVTDSARTYISLCVDDGKTGDNIYYYRARNYNSTQYRFNTRDSHSHSFYVTKGSYIKCLYNVYLYNNLSSTGTVWNVLSLQLSAPTIVCRSYADASGNKLSNQTNITINKNTWNGNIYVDNSTNLTYIYPQYTTINENNETVTNISNNPIIYNSETKQYYTYDTVTNNYYYITYEQPATPTPSPSPKPLDPILPDTQNYIIPKMNSNTFTDEHGTWVASGSSKYSDVFDFFHAFDRSTSDFWETNASPSNLQIEIPGPESYYIDGYIMRISKFNNRYPKDWTLQGSDDGKTWDDLDKQTAQNLSDLEEHKYPLTLRKAYKYYRLNMSNYASSMCSLSHFNLLGYDAKDVITPTPSPTNPPTPTTPPIPGGDNPGGSGSGSGSSSGISGGNDEGLFGWLWDLLKDLVKAILKAIFKVLSGLLGFLIWLVERVGILLPFLPAPAIAALGAGVVLVFVIRIIRFIRG